MINKKIAKQYESLLKMLKKEDDKLKEQRRINQKNRENYILRSLEDKHDEKSTR
tara:strand:- start:266 stop:427 length:162 start_codon:yes stop_codon:yes gene_type:complete